MRSCLNSLRSENLLLHACTEEMTSLAIQDKNKLSQYLNVKIDESWPVSPEALQFFLDMIKSNSDNIDWLNYIVILEKDSVVIGDVGFLGPPNAIGTIEIGYSIIPGYRRKGYATEMVNCIINWAFSNKDVKKIIANTTNDNMASIKILKSNGFKFVCDNGTKEDLMCQWEMKNPG